MKKLILDACCGGRTFWFDKEHDNVLYVDKYTRKRGIIPERPNFECKPDEVMDFRNLSFADKTFKMVVFDPPHFSDLGPNSYTRKKYGCLGKKWREELGQGFNECWRVLDDYGTLIFKWNEHEIPISQILGCFNHAPLFGHRSGKQSKTHWIVFMKIPKADKQLIL